VEAYAHVPISFYVFVCSLDFNYGLHRLLLLLITQPNSAARTVAAARHATPGARLLQLQVLFGRFVLHSFRISPIWFATRAGAASWILARVPSMRATAPSRSYHCRDPALTVRLFVPPFRQASRLTPVRRGFLTQDAYLHPLKRSLLPR
jgi:hypothetical protein